MNHFLKAYSEIERSIKLDKRLLSNVKIMALLGSVADDEQSETWSDLDILLVMKSGKSGNIPISLLDRLKQKCSRISKKYGFPISLLTHTEDDFTKYVSFEYLIHYSFGRCTYPDPKALRRLVDRILNQRQTDEGIKKNYCLYHLRHIRFNLMRKYASLNEDGSGQVEKEFLKLLIDKMVKATDLSLNLQNIWSKTKKEISKNARNHLSFNNQVLEEALQIRNNWSEIAKDLVQRFIPKGMGYIYSIFDEILGVNQEPTPEEKMSSL